MAVSARRYMTRFVCAAERCSDTCCKGLTVPLTPADSARLRERLSGNDPDRALLERGVDAQKSALRPGAGGHCAFLDADQLCGVQRRFGPEAIPEACALFPRVFTRTEAGLVLSGSLACPEVTRLLLEEDALELEPLEGEVRQPPPERQVAEDGVRQAHSGRQVAFELSGQVAVRTERSEGESKSGPSSSSALRGLAHQLLPHADGLALLAVFARELQLGEASPEELLAGFSREDVQRAVRAQLEPLRSPNPSAISLALALLRSWLGTESTDRQRGLAREVLQAFDALEAPAQTSELAARREAVERRLTSEGRAEVERTLLRAAHTMVDRLRPTPTGFAGDILELAARLAILRVWLVAQPVSRQRAADSVQLFAKYAASKLDASALLADAVPTADSLFAATCVYAL